MKITKAEYLKKYKGVNNYRGTDRLTLVEVPPDSQEQSKQPEHNVQARRRSR